MTGWAEQIVIVTGGSRGIGRAVSRALAARGAAICINYATRAVEAEAAAGEIAATGGRVIAVQADVADADAVARMVARTEAELGPVGILVTCPRFGTVKLAESTLGKSRVGRVKGWMRTPRDPIYAGHRYPAEIISYAVWLYFRFPLSLRMVEEMLAARGISVTHETIRRWGLKFGQVFANRIRQRALRRGDKWHLDEVVILSANCRRP